MFLGVLLADVNESTNGHPWIKPTNPPPLNNTGTPRGKRVAILRPAEKGHPTA